MFQFNPHRLPKGVWKDDSKNIEKCLYEKYFFRNKVCSIIKICAQNPKTCITISRLTSDVIR